MEHFRVFNPDDFAWLNDIEKSVKKNEHMGFVYLFEYGKLTKIGSSRKPYCRIQMLKQQAEGYGNVKTGRVAISIGHTNYKDNEKALHRHFSDYRKEGTELFALPFDDVCKMLPTDLSFKDDTKVLEEDSKTTTEALKKLLFMGDFELYKRKPLETAPAKGRENMNIGIYQSRHVEEIDGEKLWEYACIVMNDLVANEDYEAAKEYIDFLATIDTEKKYYKRVTEQYFESYEDALGASTDEA